MGFEKWTKFTEFCAAHFFRQNARHNEISYLSAQITARHMNLVEKYESIVLTFEISSIFDCA